MLKDVYDTAPEPDEPEQEDFELETDELYDDDQFYRENEAIPPAPKLQGDHNRPRETVMDPSSTQVPTTAEAPLLKRDDNLEGKFKLFPFPGFHFPSTRVCFACEFVLNVMYFGYLWIIKISFNKWIIVITAYYFVLQ